MKKITKSDILVGHNLLRLRVASGLSRRALSKRLDNITHQQLSKYENGTDRIPAGRLLDISKALRVPVEWFYPMVKLVEEPEIDEVIEEVIV